MCSNREASMSTSSGSAEAEPVMNIKEENVEGDVNIKSVMYTKEENVEGDVKIKCESM